MGVKIGGSATQIGKKNNFSVIMHARLLNKIGLTIWKNWTRLKKKKLEKRMKSICHYCGINVIIHTTILLLRKQKFQPTRGVS